MRIENPRTDIVSKNPFPKDKLIRLVIKNGTLNVDKIGNMSGRGIYILKEKDSIQKSKSSLSRILKKEVDDKLIEELLREL